LPAKCGLSHKVHPEEVVQSVYRSFFARYQAGQFTVANWDSLWGLLAVITLRKCANQGEHWQAARRNIGQEVQPTPKSQSTIRGRVPGREPPPDEAAILAERLNELSQTRIGRQVVVDGRPVAAQPSLLEPFDQFVEQGAFGGPEGVKMRIGNKHW